MSVVARQYDVNTNQVFGWRKRFADELTALRAAQLVRVVVTPDRADKAPPLAAADIIDIELAKRPPGSDRVRCEAASRRLVLDALERR